MEKKHVTIRQMYRSAVVVGALILLTAFTVLVMGTMSSAEVSAQNKAECTLKTLEGTYAFEARGVLRVEEGG